MPRQPLRLMPVANLSALMPAANLSVLIPVLVTGIQLPSVREVKGVFRAMDMALLESWTKHRNEGEVDIPDLGVTMQNDDTFSETLTGAEALSEVMADLEDRSARFGAALTGALRSATIGGKGLEDILRGLGNRLVDIGLAAGLKPLEGLLTNAIGGMAGSVTPFADGGVVRSPSFFPMGGGDMGLMGEAGAEAILPLKRGPDGVLGVAAGGGGGGMPQVVFNVTATDAASFRKSEGQISAMLARSVARGRRGL